MGVAWIFFTPIGTNIVSFAAVIRDVTQLFSPPPPLVGEKRCVTILITAAKETSTNKNTLQGTTGAPNVELLGLNTLRGIKTSFLTPNLGTTSTQSFLNRRLPGGINYVKNKAEQDFNLRGTASGTAITSAKNCLLPFTVKQTKTKNYSLSNTLFQVEHACLMRKLQCLLADKTYICWKFKPWKIRVKCGEKVINAIFTEHLHRPCTSQCCIKWHFTPR